jgi:hypothetical protein
VLFLKILQKSFVFLHKKGNPAGIGVIFLYNLRGFREISMVFNVVQARLALFLPWTAKLSQGVATNGIIDVK